MEHELSEEQVLFGAEVRRFLERNYSFDQRRASVAASDGVNPKIWAGLSDLGVLALPYPEELGGLDADPLTLGLVMEALGSHLVVEPVLASMVFAGTAVAIGGSDVQRTKWLGPAAVGEVKLALADEDAVGATTIAHRTASGPRLAGRKAYAPGATAADAILISAGSELFLVASDAPGLTLSPVRLVDGGRSAEITLDDVEAEPLPGGFEGLAAARAAATLASCWEAVGAMGAAHAQTMDYIRQREQFGKTIASFQVVQHTAAGMAVACEEARAACMLAALRPGGRTLAAAKVKTARGAETVAKNAVQLHGGMGVSDELAIASYFRKLLAFTAQFGAPREHLNRYAAEVLGRRGHHQSVVLPSLEAAA